MIEINRQNTITNEMEIGYDYYHTDKIPANKVYHNLDNYSVFNLLLQDDTASLSATYGHIDTYIKENEDVIFSDEHLVLFMNITYEKGLHILKTLGYEKDYVRFLPFNIDIGDNIDYSSAIYYEENWKKIQ